MRESLRRPLVTPTLRGVHHLALCTDDMKATIDFYVDVLGMPLVHAMKVPLDRRSLIVSTMATSFGVAAGRHQGGGVAVFVFGSLTACSQLVTHPRHKNGLGRPRDLAHSFAS